MLYLRSLSSALVARLKKVLGQCFSKGHKQIFFTQSLFDKVKKITSEHLFLTASDGPESFAATRRRSCRYEASRYIFLLLCFAILISSFDYFSSILTLAQNHQARYLHAYENYFVASKHSKFTYNSVVE